jgi:hypothetical protein
MTQIRDRTSKGKDRQTVQRGVVEIDACKSGTNGYHGSAGYVIRPSDAGKSSEYYDTIATQLVSRGCTTCVVNPNPTLMQWGGAVGGPIKKDKLFFFGAYDQQRQRIPHQVFFSTLATLTPTAVTQEAYDAFKGGTFVSPTAGTINYPALGSRYGDLEHQ